jgi:hypothetical protein
LYDGTCIFRLTDNDEDEGIPRFSVTGDIIWSRGPDKFLFDESLVPSLLSTRTIPDTYLHDGTGVSNLTNVLAIDGFYDINAVGRRPHRARSLRARPVLMLYAIVNEVQVGYQLSEQILVESKNDHN